MQSSASTILTMAMLCLTASSHIIMTSPVPFGRSSLTLDPLAADGSNFPCKQRQGVYDAEGASNTAAVGDEIPLNFKGSAVHGGGSCQISLTSDKAPTADSKWFVIHSIEGGCPAKNTDGNGQDGSVATSNYTFKIPDGVAPGDYTLAWTWFNKIGNREMYMNCAPFTITGGKKRGIEARKEAERMSKRQGNFPDMYRANSCGGCKTMETVDVKFPDPGASVDVFSSDPSKMWVPTCDCNGAVKAASNAGSSDGSGSGSGSSSGGSSGGSASPAPSAASSAASQPASQAPATTVPAASAVSSSSAEAPMSSSNTASAPASQTTDDSEGDESDEGDDDDEPDACPAGTTPAPASGSSSSGSGNTPAPAESAAPASAAGTQACTSPGALVCSADGKMFGICDSDNKAVMSAVATGTKCTSGGIAADSS